MKKIQTRWLLLLECERCGGIVKRSIQDIVNLLKGDAKAQTKCPHCGASITYKIGLLPKDIS